MNQRSLLRSQINQAWQQAIETNYQRQRINSERSLQAAVWSQLNTIFEDSTRRMFIEPGIVIHTTGVDGAITRTVRIPDMVVCNSREIIAVLELKYQPRVKPTYAKDLATLAWISNAREQVAISNTRFRGVEADARTYKLASSVLYVWAGIHSDANASLSPPAEIASNFLELHAVTAHDEPPVFRRGRGSSGDL